MVRTTANKHPSIAAKTTDSAALLSSFEEAIRLEVAAEMNHTLKCNEYNDLLEAYAFDSNFNLMDRRAVTDRGWVQGAYEATRTAANKLDETRYKLGIVRSELQKLIRKRTEAVETLAAPSEDIKVEEGSNRWLVLN